MYTMIVKPVCLLVFLSLFLGCKDGEVVDSNGNGSKDKATSICNLKSKLNSDGQEALWTQIPSNSVIMGGDLRVLLTIVNSDNNYFYSSIYNWSKSNGFSKVCEERVGLKLKPNDNLGNWYIFNKFYNTSDVSAQDFIINKVNITTDTDRVVNYSISDESSGNSFPLDFSTVQRVFESQNGQLDELFPGQIFTSAILYKRNNDEFEYITSIERKDGDLVYKLELKRALSVD